MNTNPTLNTPVVYAGKAGTVVGIGTVYRDDRPVPQWIVATAAGTIRVTGNEVYGMEAR